MPDYYGDITRAAELGKPEELQVAKEEWRARALQYLASSRAKDDDEPARKRRKVYRVKAFTWLSATDNMLRATLGQGWAYFCPPRDPNDPYAWPVMVCSPDQGSDGWCALQYLTRLLHAAVEVQHCASHSGNEFPIRPIRPDAA